MPVAVQFPLVLVFGHCLFLNNVHVELKKCVFPLVSQKFPVLSIIIIDIMHNVYIVILLC